MTNVQAGRVRILIVDEHRMFREGLRALLDMHDDLCVVGEAADGSEALAAVARLHPDLVLLDLAMPGRPRVATLRALSSQWSNHRVIILTASISDEEVVAAVKCGARGIVLKDEASETLQRAIRAVMAGECWIGQRGVTTLVNVWRGLSQGPPKPDYHLTSRELEVVGAVVGAYSNREIAAKLQISEKTVKHHLSSVFDKVGVSSRLELALFAVNHTLELPEAAD